jgi:hypothetical protein
MIFKVYKMMSGEPRRDHEEFGSLVYGYVLFYCSRL